MAEKAKKMSKEGNGGKSDRQARVFTFEGALRRGVDEVDHLLAAGKMELTLDFRNCDFISVEGLEWLEEMLLRSRSLNATVRFLNVRPTVYKVFKVAHIESIMEACGAPTLGPAC
ncbi:MAG TPA: STAS domain-containing protein [Candidatus Obscuribacterales bacterium]